MLLPLICFAGYPHAISPVLTSHFQGTLMRMSEEVTNSSCRTGGRETRFAYSVSEQKAGPLGEIALDHERAIHIPNRFMCRRGNSGVHMDAFVK